jgi:DNA repair protein RadD
MLDLFATAKEPKQLRPHQVKAVEMIRSSLKSGNSRVVCAMPTGAGKTLTAAKIISMALEKGNRVIFTAPAISLIDQTVTAFEDEGISGIGVIQASHPRTNPDAIVQVASVQTLARREIPNAALVIVDECHMGFDVIADMIKTRSDVFFIGLSATPWAKGMGLLWQDLVVPVTIGDLIEQGYLSKFAAYAPDVPDLSGVKVRAGEYVESGLEAVMGDAKLMGNVVHTWLERGENRPTLCFAVNRAHAANLQTEFTRNGVSAGYVDANTDMVERHMINRQFRAGEIKVICSVRTMTTGVDLPVSCIIDAAPTKSEMLHVQKIGRGLRVNPGTEDCLILDHAGNSLRLGLVTDIAHLTLDKSGPKEKQEPKPKNEKLPKPCSQCGTLHIGLICPTCGHEKKPMVNFDVVDGDLVEITGRKIASAMADKQRFWSMALWVDAERGKGGKLAKALYRGKFNVWPQGLLQVSLAPDRAFLNYERSRRIAYAKKMGGK